MTRPPRLPRPGAAPSPGDESPGDRDALLRSFPPTRGAFPVLLVVLAVLALPVSALAQSIEATVDRTEATEEDFLRLTLTITGVQGGPAPRLPELPDFEVIPRGQSSQISIVNGRTTASVQHNYLLAPKGTGTFTIGPATVEIDGRSYQSRPITVKIVEASRQPQESRDAYTTASVSTTTPWVGQQVIYTWRLLHRVQLGEARLESQEFDSFLIEDLGEVREYQTTINGLRYAVSEIKKALFPQEVGEVTVPASVLRCQVAVERDDRRRRTLFDVFGRVSFEPRALRPQPIELDVRPLPPAPAGFSGLVGSFDLTAEISKRELAVGESATLEITVSGAGNAQMIPEPRIPALPAFKIYDEKPSVSLERSGGRLAGRKSYSKALVPLEPGELAVPPLALTYFDPEAGTYRTARTEGIPLSVSPAEGQEDLRLTESLAPTTGKVAVRILADDILPLYEGLDALTVRRAGPLPGPLLLGGLALPPLLFGTLLLMRRRQQRFAADTGLKRRRAALGTARRELAKVVAAGGAAPAAQLASRAVRGYAGDKLGLEGTALTPAETAQRLREAGVGEDAAGRVRALLERLEAAQYGAATVEPGALVAEIRPLLGELEGVLR